MLIDVICSFKAHRARDFYLVYLIFIFLNFLKIEVPIRRFIHCRAFKCQMRRVC